MNFCASVSRDVVGAFSSLDKFPIFTLLPPSLTPNPSPKPTVIKPVGLSVSLDGNEEDELLTYRSRVLQSPKSSYQPRRDPRSAAVSPRAPTAHLNNPLGAQAPVPSLCLPVARIHLQRSYMLGQSCLVSCLSTLLTRLSLELQQAMASRANCGKRVRAVLRHTNVRGSADNMTTPKSRRHHFSISRPRLPRKTAHRRRTRGTKKRMISPRMAASGESTQTTPQTCTPPTGTSPYETFTGGDCSVRMSPRPCYTLHVCCHSRVERNSLDEVRLYLSSTMYSDARV